MALQGYGLRMHDKAPLCHGRAKHGYDHNRIGSVKHGGGIGLRRSDARRVSLDSHRDGIA